VIKVSDYIVNYISSLGVNHVFGLAGGQIMHLMDSVHRHELLEYTAVLHEQAAAMMAEAYSRATDSYGVCMVTTGPGGTNAMTGLASAWYDSTPCMFISGQFRLEVLPLKNTIRQSALQQTFPVELVRPITKYSVLVEKACDIRFYLEKAYYLSRSGRPGPVWLDIPLDIQGSYVNESELTPFIPNDDELLSGFEMSSAVDRCLRMIGDSRRSCPQQGSGLLWPKVMTC